MMNYSDQESFCWRRFVIGARTDLIDKSGLYNCFGLTLAIGTDCKSAPAKYEYEKT